MEERHSLTDKFIRLNTSVPFLRIGQILHKAYIITIISTFRHRFRVIDFHRFNVSVRQI